MSRKHFALTHHSSFITRHFFTPLLFAVLVRRLVLPARSERRQKLFDARRRLFDRVAHEMKFGSVLEVEQDTQLAADVWRGVLKRLERGELFALAPGCGHVNACVSQI